MARKNKREAFLNGCFLGEDEASVSIFDRGLLYGDGLFETLRTYGPYGSSVWTRGKAFRLEAHLQRLAQSAAFLQIPLPFKKDEIKEALRELLRRNGLSEAYVRITLTRGRLTGRLDLHAKEPTLLIVTREFEPYPARLYREGMKAIISRTRRSPSSPVIQHKTLNYLPNILARAEALQSGADEAIFLNTAGFLTEATVSNLFLVKEGEVFTPPVSAGLLPGITRAVVLEICHRNSIPSREKNLRPRELARADEAFLTNSLMEIMPLCFVKGRPIGNGRVGGVTRRLRRLYRGAVKRELKL